MKLKALLLLSLTAGLFGCGTGMGSISEKYQELERVLTEGDISKASDTTKDIILTVTSRVDEGVLDIDSIENFPCEDLRKIDELWVSSGAGVLNGNRTYLVMVGSTGFDIMFNDSLSTRAKDCGVQ
ncbi:MAG: GUN4 domain-containing protein [Tildeniella torsiva UHER 1998/13D]|jgi:hypothetical protein|nr:GUN4 domain-containing protein [Tildeniella torsiva UHER 1998/13D]